MKLTTETSFSESRIITIVITEKKTVTARNDCRWKNTSGSKTVFATQHCQPWRASRVRAQNFVFYTITL